MYKVLISGKGNSNPFHTYEKYEKEIRADEREKTIDEFAHWLNSLDRDFIISIYENSLFKECFNEFKKVSK